MTASNFIIIAACYSRLRRPCLAIIKSKIDVKPFLSHKKRKLRVGRIALRFGGGVCSRIPTGVLITRE